MFSSMSEHMGVARCKFFIPSRPPLYESYIVATLSQVTFLLTHILKKVCESYGNN
jgi:hypothetical protein